MVIKSKLTKQDFINLNFILLYSKISMKVLTALTAFLFLVSIVASIFSNHDYFPAVIFLFILLIFTPLHTYISAVRNFKASNRGSETIEYHFDNEYLSVKGESFNAQLSWDKIYKVTQTKNWILIWQNRQAGNPIPKGNISEEQIGELKEILDNHKVKNNL